MSYRYNLASAMISIFICGLVLIVGGYVSDVASGTSSPNGGVKEVMREDESAEFIDLSDAGAVRRWAQGMCEGLKLDEVAPVLDIEEPTVATVAQGLTSGMPEPAESIARKTCEEELRKANQAST